MTRMEPDSRVIGLITRLSRISAAVTVLGGLLVLVGWARGIEQLKSVVPGLVTMKPLGASCFLFSGLALWLLHGNAARTAVGRFCAWFPVVVGLCNVIEYAFDCDFGIDEILFRSAVNATDIPYPGRMAPATSVLFILVGVALLLLDYETRDGLYPSSHLALMTALGGALSLLGYLYSVGAMTELHAYTTIGLHTSLLFGVIGLGVFFARPWRGAAAVIASGYGGGMMSRRILPLAILLPYVAGWLRQEGELAGLYGASFGQAAFAGFNILFFTILVWMVARDLNREEEERRARRDSDAARAEARPDGDAKRDDRRRDQGRIFDLAQLLVREMDGRIVQWNRGSELLYGFTQQEAIGRVSHKLLRTEFPEPPEEIEKKLRENASWEGQLIHYKKDGTRMTVASKWVLHTGGKSLRVLESNSDITRFIGARGIDGETRSLPAGLAAELNNALVAISGYAGFAAQDLPADHPAQRDVREIVKASNRAANLMNELEALNGEPEKDEASAAVSSRASA